MLIRKSKYHSSAARSANARFSHPITIIFNYAKNDLDAEQWREFALCFAQIEPLYGQHFTMLENMGFGNLLSEECFLFKIRYIESIKKNMRIIFKDRQFEIKRIINEGEKNYLLNLITIEI